MINRIYIDRIVARRGTLNSLSASVLAYIIIIVGLSSPSAISMLKRGVFIRVNRIDVEIGLSHIVMWTNNGEHSLLPLMVVNAT